MVDKEESELIPLRLSLSFISRELRERIEGRMASCRQEAVSKPEVLSNGLESRGNGAVLSTAIEDVE